MKNYLIAAVSCLLLITCKKDIPINKVLSNFSIVPRDVQADGQSILTVSVQLADHVSTDRKNIVFTATNAIFQSSGTDKITVAATYIDGKIIAKTNLRVSTKPGQIKITAQPEFDSPIKEFALADSVVSSPSLPTSIHLEPSSFGISKNFLTEITLTATLAAASGKFVSQGNEVLFEDSLITGGPAKGYFRAQQNSTMDSSKGTSIYGAYGWPNGTEIRVRSTLLINKQKTNISDFVIITINQ